MGTTPPAAPVGYGRQREVSFLQDGVTPPSALYIGPGEGLDLRYASLDVGRAVHVYLRILNPQGKIIPYKWDFLTLAAGAPAVQRLLVGEGFLLSASVTVDPLGNRTGRAFIHLELVQIGAGALYPAYTLIHGYTRLLDHLMWPPAVNQPLGSVHGNMNEVASAVPAPGAEILIAATLNSIQRVQSIRFTLLTSAGGGNRVVLLRLISGGFARWEGGANIAQPSSTFYTYVASTAPVQGPLGADYFAIPLPADLCLDNLRVMATVTAGIQAADQYSFASTYVETWIQEP